MEELENEFTTVLTKVRERATVMEVFTKDLDNEIVLKDYFNAIAEKCLIGNC